MSVKPIRLDRQPVMLGPARTLKTHCIAQEFLFPLGPKHSAPAVSRRLREAAAGVSLR
jgi:hypothetical protein